MREALISAALDLFSERGFEQATVDDIVARAGVGRRSFFRYFPSKESVVFPDHEGCLADMTAFLADRAGDREDPVQRVCEAARLVLRMYAADPDFSLRRYALTRQVPALRAHELAVVWRYERTLGDYLKLRFAERPDGRLRAEVIASAVVAGHNHALRSWLRSGCTGDVEAQMDEALGWVLATAWGTDGQAAGAEGRPDAADGPAHAGPDTDEVVVVVTRRGTPVQRVVERVRAALEE